MTREPQTTVFELVILAAAILVGLYIIFGVNGF